MIGSVACGISRIFSPVLVSPEDITQSSNKDASVRSFQQNQWTGGPSSKRLPGLQSFASVSALLKCDWSPREVIWPGLLTSSLRSIGRLTVYDDRQRRRGGTV